MSKIGNKVIRIALIRCKNWLYINVYKNHVKSNIKFNRSTTKANTCSFICSIRFKAHHIASINAYFCVYLASAQLQSHNCSCNKICRLHVELILLLFHSLHCYQIKITKFNLTKRIWHKNHPFPIRIFTLRTHPDASCDVGCLFFLFSIFILLSTPL